MFEDVSFLKTIQEFLPCQSTSTGENLQWIECLSWGHCKLHCLLSARGNTSNVHPSMACNRCNSNSRIAKKVATYSDLTPVLTWHQIFSGKWRLLDFEQTRAMIAAMTLFTRGMFTLAVRVPWIVVNFSETLQKLWFWWPINEQNTQIIK